MSNNGPQPVESNQTPTTMLSSLPPKADATGSPSSGEGPVKSRRRRRGADTESQPKNQSFYFVDSTSSSKEKRAHVMRHHVQEKRKHRKLSQGSLQPEHAPARPTARLLKMDSGHGAEIPQGAIPAVETAPSFGQQPMIPSPHISTFVHESGESRIESPEMMHGLSRVTQFPTPAIIQNPEDVELADWWVNKLTYWSGQNPYVKTQIYRTAMEHPFSFQAVILVYAARWKAQMNGQDNSKEVQRHVGQVRKNLEDAASGLIQVPEDQLATALAGMALAEGRFGSCQDAEQYLSHAIRIVRHRRGTPSAVEVFVHYVRSILPPLSDAITPINRCALVSFLQQAQELLQRHGSPQYQPQSSHRRTAFQMGSPLFSLLSSGPRPTQVPQEAHMYVVRSAETQEASRSGCLIYITAALWDFRDSVSKTHRFLAYLTSLVEEHQLGKHPACETLLWLLLEQTCDADLRDPERVWSTGQLLQTHRQLRPDLQFHYNELLMSFLSLQVPVRGIDVFETELEASFGGRRHSPHS